MLEKSPADIFLRNPCIVTNTAWKLEVIVSNLTKFIDKHFSDFTIAFAAGYMDTVLSMPISVEEEDSMIGTPDLIRNKARDQVLKMWSMSIDRERRDLVPHEFNQIVEEGGEFGTIASDVAAREIWITENNQKVGNWRRVLNFHFSKPAGKMTAKEMRKEMDEYCDSEYGTLGRKASRAVDATIGLTNVVFPVRTAIHKKQEIYVPPQEVFVFAGRETAGITMDVHPLSDQNHRAQFFAVLEPGDPVSGMNLLDGGHLTHGWKVSATAKFFESHPYHVLPNGHTDFEELKRIAKQFKPKLIWCGATAYPRTIEFAQFAEIADSIGAYLVADISHISGLVAAGVHESPVPYVHIITTTTHKTLRGPRGAMIMVTKKGLEKDPELASKIDKAIFPGLQGGPHNHTTAAIAVALKEAATPAFKEYAKQIVKNTKTLEQEFSKAGIKMVSGGSDNHLLLLDLSVNGTLGSQLEYAMDVAHMTANKNTIPGEKSSPYYPSGLRLGTPALTTRGFKEADMVHVADWIVRVIHHIERDALPKEQSERAGFIKAIHTKYDGDPFLKKIGEEIKAYTKAFPIPGI